MANRSIADIHPQQRGLKRIKAKVGGPSRSSYPHLKDTPYWGEFSTDQKHYLAAYPMFHNDSDTSVYIGKKAQWGKDLRNSDGHFLEALEHIRLVVQSYGLHYYEKEWLVPQAARAITEALAGSEISQQAVRMAQYIHTRNLPKNTGRPKKQPKIGEEEDKEPEFSLEGGLGLGY